MDRRKSIRAPLGNFEAATVGLAELLRNRTRTLHVEAERSGIIRELLRGSSSRQGYALLLRNLLPAYSELERGLDRHVNSRGVRAIVRPALYRALAIEADLVGLAGSRWIETLALLPAGTRYRRSIAAAADGDGARLIAHAYLRYLGDLSGGQIIKRLLAKSLGLGAAVLSFYDFPDIADVGAFKADYRSALERAAIEIGDIAPILDEAENAFRLNIALSEAVFTQSRVRDTVGD
jgi:heme oxygenase (biliverdin-producing, ferredoxin)